jgi:hypothetical protein
MTNVGGSGIGLWGESDEFYHDVPPLPDGNRVPLKVRSMVGLIPLFAVEVLDEDVFRDMPEFTSRLRWFSITGPISQRWCRAGTERTATKAACCRCCAGTG